MTRAHSRQEERNLLRRFWKSASGFWRGPSAWWVWPLTAFLFVTVVLQLLVQYWMNYWNRDFFNAIQERNTAAVWMQAKIFLPLLAASIAVAMISIWGRMTMQRQWRQWLSKRLYDYWLTGDHVEHLKSMASEAQTPEYRIAEDARVATEAPVDLVLGLFTSIITAGTFIGVLWTIGDVLAVQVLGSNLVIPRYLVIAVIANSIMLATVTLVVGRNFENIIEGKNQAEAQLRSAGSHVGETGGRADGRSEIVKALNQVIARWRDICWQFVRLTFVSQTNLVLTPVIALLLCMPKYLQGSLTLGEVVQASAAFGIVQGAFNWIQDNFGRIADWTSSANRVASLLFALDEVDGQSAGGGSPPAPRSGTIARHREGDRP
ncbi:MAG TPA: SbmA/BacA-like family transporter [Xanthobacteraceae bacterium]|nr:SbmA/BacA-like family transporter [Xanthobacteraceae bacterium]